MTRPRATSPDALLLFVTEPQQLDAVVEFGTETLTPDSIRVPARTVLPRPVFGRCWCGRPIRTDGATECAECD